MDKFFAKLRRFNTDWNDLPRRALMVVATCLALLVLAFLFKYLAPFVCALVFSFLIRPIAKPLERLLVKLRLPKKIGSIVAVVLVFGVLSALLVFLLAALTREAQLLLSNLPDTVQTMADYITDFVNNAMDKIQDQVGDEAIKSVYEVLMSALNRLAELASGFAGMLVSFTWSAVMTLPEIALFVTFTIMESYYVVADRELISEFLKRWAPQKTINGVKKLKGLMFMGVRAQIVTAIIQMLAAIALLMVGFYIIGERYAVMLAILISVLDALPVIGAGLIMLPMTAYYIITGEYMLALGVMVLYCLVIVMKRIMEPKLIGKQMRLHQLATMMAMYAGFVIMGFIGLLAGPLLLMLLTAVLSGAFEENREVLKS